MCSEEPVFFYHGYTTDGYRFTIAGRYQPLLKNDEDTEPDVIMLGASLCSKSENFAKKLGRIKAEGRMKSKENHGRTYYALYDEFNPLDWFADKKMTVFVEAAKLNESLTRAGFMRKFSL